MHPFTKPFPLQGKKIPCFRFSFLKKITLSAFLIGSLFSSKTVYAQKPPLDHDVYDDWQSVGARSISPNGKWTTYTINPQEGDKWLYIQATNSTSAQEEIHRAENAKITADSKHIVFRIKPFYEEIKENRIQKKKKSKDKKELTKDSLGIYNLSNRNLEKISDIISFEIPKENADYLAYIRELKEEEKDSISKKNNTYRKLVLRNLVTQEEVSFNHIKEYKFSKDGKYLAYSYTPHSEKEEDTDEDIITEPRPQGVYIVRTQDMQTIEVTPQSGTYNKLTFDEESQLLTFLATHDKEKEEIKEYSIYLFNIESHTLTSLDHTLEGIPENWVISENYSPNFSQNSKSLYLGIAPRKEPKDSTFIEEDHAILDIWHYKDDYLQTQQLARLEKDLKKSYLSVVHLNNTSTLIPLQDETINYSRLVDKGNADFVFAMSDYGRRIEKQWTGSGIGSYYLINTKTGEKEEVIKDLEGTAYISPEGKNIVFFDRNTANWYVYDISTKKILHLNRDLEVGFANELHDLPASAYPYSLIGWTEDDASVLINDRYDIWQFDLIDDTAPINITHSYGRNHKINFRYLKLDKEATHINLNDKVILSAFQEQDKTSGFYELDVKRNRTPKKLMMEAMSGHRSLIRAKDKDIYLFVRQSFQIPPTLVSSKNLKNFTKLHQTNPQQEKYNWGSVELIHYTSQNGKPATGMLYKPEDFDANKKYPLIAYFYERRSDNLHGYEPPAPTPSRLNITYFVSNGYLVFVPDIEYTIGYPGRSAEEYIDAGIDYLKTFDYINGDKIGIQGQSWGGYQVAHLITRSNRYAAAWAGAPVVNMTSAYGGIRWTSGMNRQFQYEKTQSRIGQNLWEGYDLYIENSPLFFMEEVTTPVVIMHNDKDGAVPWYQGIEMFTALRRLEKPVWLLNYNNDEHNLIKRQNRKDIQRREQQFFDHYLKDAPAPEWMVNGIPAVQKGKTWGFELTDKKP